MSTLTFQVTFLSDIVLPASSKTEGKIEQLDFIPGSNFLGMVARQYDDFDNSLDIFHSGKVKFGDAHILKDGKQTYKVPSSYFHEKLDDSEIVNHHHIKNFSGFVQLKQMRKGYITKDIEPVEIIDIKYNYTQKSGYDKTKRRSKDSSMYGYHAIKSGTIWQFDIDYYDEITEKDLGLIKSNIEGKKRLGKSKSSQYGEVEIVEKSSCETIEDLEYKTSDNEILIYAYSRLALVDENGNPTYDLKYLVKGLKDVNIVYKKCQIRTSTFSRYDGSRKTTDYERVVIDKGSVIVLKDISSDILSDIQNAVGAYLSEGFGKVIINPAFLQDARKQKISKDVDSDKIKIKKPITGKFENTIQFLVNRHNDSISQLTSFDRNKQDIAQNFINIHKEDYAQITNSQWGNIRSFCNNYTEDEIVEKVQTYISHGKSKWSDNQISLLIDAIKNSKTKLKFTKFLAMQMPKQQEINHD